jgi:hypothetical protein
MGERSEIVRDEQGGEAELCPQAMSGLPENLRDPARRR